MLDFIEILEDIKKENRSIIVTLPSNIAWSDYKKELDKVKDYKNVLNFKVYNFPKDISKGSKCYVAHNGYVKGWLEIVGFSEKEFICNVTGKEWSGKFIERSGPFHYIDKEIPMRGFQGYRYFSEEDY